MQVLLLRDSKAWQLQVWVSFLAAAFLCGVGLAYLPARMEVNETCKACLGVSWMYLITCTFTLAKTLRDAHEADLGEAHRQGRLSRGAD